MRPRRGARRDGGQGIRGRNPSRRTSTIKRSLIWIVPLILAVLLVIPSPIAERYTSPTQDGQFLTHPIKSYRFVIDLALASGSAELSAPGEALQHAKTVFADSGKRPVRVSLLHLAGRDSYTHVTKSRNVLVIDDPPALVWEIWGRDVDPSSPLARTTEVVGFLDYKTGQRVGERPIRLQQPAR